eukprot:Platyproteum_vivax@DN13944_c0_g1_i1.p1
MKLQHIIFVTFILFCFQISMSHDLASKNEKMVKVMEGIARMHKAASEMKVVRRLSIPSKPVPEDPAPPKEAPTDAPTPYPLKPTAKPTEKPTEKPKNGTSSAPTPTPAPTPAPTFLQQSPKEASEA